VKTLLELPTQLGPAHVTQLTPQATADHIASESPQPSGLRCELAPAFPTRGGAGYPGRWLWLSWLVLAVGLLSRRRGCPGRATTVVPMVRLLSRFRAPDRKIESHLRSYGQSAGAARPAPPLPLTGSAVPSPDGERHDRSWTGPPRDLRPREVRRGR
jgi:hypothetical protein